MAEERSALFLRQLFDEAANAHDGDYPDKVNAGILAVYDCGRREERYISSPQEAGGRAGELPCRTDGRCQYAIDHGAEGLGHCPAGRCAQPVRFGPLDGDCSNTALENWFPISAENLKRAQEAIAHADSARRDDAKDAERFEWLCGPDRHVSRRGVDLVRSDPCIQKAVHFYINGKHTTVEGATLREAVDAAQLAQNGSKS